MGFGLLFLGIITLGILLFIAIVILSIAYIFLPPIFREFLKVIKLYYDMRFKHAIIRHIIHFFIFLIFFSILIMVIYSLKVSWLYLFSLAIFLQSAFFGFYILLFFLYSAYYKSWKRVSVALLLGAILFIPFSISSYFVFKPIYHFYNTTHHQKVDNNYDKCHEKEDWWVGGECTSKNLTINDVVGKWTMQKNEDVKNAYKNSYFILYPNGKVNFHAYYVVKSSYNNYDYIDKLDDNGTWKLHLKGKAYLGLSFNPDERHPYIEIKTKKVKSIIFRFNSKYGTTLYLQNQYEDIDAPHYLTYKKE